METFSSPFSSSLNFFLEPLSSGTLALLEPLSPADSLLRLFVPCRSGAGSKPPGVVDALVFVASPGAFSVVVSVESLDAEALEEWLGQMVGLRPWGGVMVWAWAGCK